MARTAERRKTGAKKKRSHKKKNSTQPPWGWLLLGLLIGLGIGLALYLLRLPVQSQSTTPAAPPKSAPATPQKKTRKAPPPAAEPEAQAPRFDFYTLLPQIEVEITPDKLEEALRTLPKMDRGGTYILQCGSFRDYGDADELKARLALLGIEAQIQTVVIKNNESWHRVRVGPLKGLSAVKPVRRKLKHNDINFVLLKVGD